MSIHELNQESKKRMLTKKVEEKNDKNREIFRHGKENGRSGC
jgi:hypothetical protein